MSPDILYEDDQLLICVKPAGLATQSANTCSPDLVSILKNYIHQNQIHKKQPYLAVIHRLDQPVEGLLVFAKTPAAAKQLNRQLTSFGFGKHYRALLRGTPLKTEDTLTDYLIKDARSNTSRICSPDTSGSKKACLHYQIIETKGDCSLAEIALETGRHHQIRVQMANLGTPIVGDRKYGGCVTAADSNSPLQLFACRLTLTHPQSGKKMEFHLDRLGHID